jgi:hypothetical protein
MDTTGKMYLAILVASVVGAVVAFWFISRKAPRGTLLAVGVLLWVAGRSIASQRVREMQLVSGICTLSGIIGALLGLFDVLRRRKEKESPSKGVRKNQEETPPPPSRGA